MRVSSSYALNGIDVDVDEADGVAFTYQAYLWPDVEEGWPPA